LLEKVESLSIYPILPRTCDTPIKTRYSTSLGIRRSFGSSHRILESDSVEGIAHRPQLAPPWVGFRSPMEEEEEEEEEDYSYSTIL
jgi:hypothetical protein